QFVTSYPRALTVKWLRPVVPSLYFLGACYAVLLPTRLMYGAPPSPGQTTLYGPLFWPLNYTLTAALLLGLGWTAYLALRGKTPAERTGGRALTMSVVLPLLVYGGFVAAGVSAVGEVQGLDLYFLIFMACMGYVLGKGTLEPPIPSTFR